MLNLGHLGDDLNDATRVAIIGRQIFNITEVAQIADTFVISSYTFKPGHRHEPVAGNLHLFIKASPLPENKHTHIQTDMPNRYAGVFRYFCIKCCDY